LNASNNQEIAYESIEIKVCCLGSQTYKPELTEELPPGFSELSSREKQVLRLIAKGGNSHEIAQALCLSEGTVRNHISHILTRLNVRDRIQAAILATPFLSWLETE